MTGSAIRCHAKTFLTGYLTCETQAQGDILRAHIDDHIRLTLAEAGCEKFEITPGEDPLIWEVSEVFRDQTAFDNHQTRTKASAWGRATLGIKREFKISGG